jgi:hypothetical protein
MSSDRPRQTPADFVAIALSPALIMGLVGSLVFFLVEVFYKTDGEWKGRLQWVLFFYVFGIVLAARVSMIADISGRAGMYGALLAFLTYLGLGLYVEYPEEVKDASWLINLFLVGVVWWCAYRLTWDCTNVDEQTDMSGEGLLQAAGLEAGQGQGGQEVSPEEGSSAKPQAAGRPPTWWERYRRYREEKQKRRTLGVWVVYFSLAAFPLFGLGQSLIPVVDEGRRRFCFWLMTLYVACGLGLLLTTCFLGLRRYLRQRRLQMPAAMTGVWLTAGGTLIVLLVAAGALLPRPSPEYLWLGVIDTPGSAKRQANRMALKGDSPGEGEGQPGASRKDGKAPGGEKGEKGQGQGEGKDKGGQGGDKGKDNSGKGNDKDSGGKDGKGKDSSKSDKGAEKSDSSDKGGEAPKQDKGGQGGKAAKGLKGMSEHKDSRSTSGGSSSRRASFSGLREFLSKVGPVLKWVVFGVLVVVVLLFLFRGALGFLANFTDWAKRLLDAWRKFWANLFGGGERKQAEGGGEAGEAPGVRRELPFSAFPNPFDSGEARAMSSAELVRYTFAALQAWARERDLSRQAGETALEFAARLGEELPALDADVRRLAALYARAAYSPGGLPAGSAEVVRGFWERLERVSVQPLSA